MAEAEKPSVLVLGGCGFIGRNFVEFLIDNDLVSKIKIADKTLPALAFLEPKMKDLYKNSEIITFKQADLGKPDHMDRIFNDEQFDYVFNCCGETRMGKAPDDYTLRNVMPAKTVSARAEKAGIQKWVQLSDCRVYKAGKTKCTEKMNTGPITNAARACLEAEGVVTSKSFPSTILRVPLVYGPGDRESLTPRILCAVVYQDKKEKMKFLWSKSLAINCVHVRDVCSAMWTAALKAKDGSIYNVVDDTNLDQGKFNAILGKIFGIKTGFVNMGINMAARAALGTVAEVSNEKHVPAFANICMKHNLLNTPLTPYMDKEILRNVNLLVDGELIKKELGFQLKHPKCNEKLVKEVIRRYMDQGLFPPVVKV